VGTRGSGKEDVAAEIGSVEEAVNLEDEARSTRLAHAD